LPPSQRTFLFVMDAWSLGSSSTAAESPRSLFWRRLTNIERSDAPFSEPAQQESAASLWMNEFQSKILATMISDGAAVFDRFRKVDDNIIFGLMNGKSALGKPLVENGRGYYFYLERIAEFPAPLVA
jgi:hypothetical protein